MGRGGAQHRRIFVAAVVRANGYGDAFKLLLPKRRKVYCCFRVWAGTCFGFLFISLRLRMLVQ